MELGQPGITIKMLLDSRIITPGTTVVGGRNNEHTGTITEDGSIRLLSKNNITKDYPSPSGAAKALMNLNINGWTFWKLSDLDGYKDLAYYREKYRSLHNKEPQSR